MSLKNLRTHVTQFPTSNNPKAMRNRKHSHLIAGFTLGALLGTSQAATINWGGAFFTTNYSADGTQLETGPTAVLASGEVMYELGIFQNADGTEFIPTYANADEWAHRWVVFEANDSTIDSATSGYDETFGYFGNIASMGDRDEQITSVSSSESGGNLVTGFQAYIWGFDTKDLDGPEQPEWFLVTGKDGGATGAATTNWVVPDSSATNNISFDIQWDIASASEAIVGRIDNNIGAGGMVDPVPGGGFDPSDHQFATVPEPSSIVLLLLGAAGLLRRKRQAHRANEPKLSGTASL
jgi:hypothetical protein